MGMTEYITFEGQIDPMEWGRATCTILRLPDAVVEGLNGAKRVTGEINDHPVNLAITTAPVIDGAFLWAGKSLLSRVGVGVGDRFEVRLCPADPDQLDTPEDVQAALISAGKSSNWEALSAGKRRGMLYQVETAKRTETRTKRITKLIATLS